MNVEVVDLYFINQTQVCGQHNEIEFIFLAKVQTMHILGSANPIHGLGFQEFL